MDNTTNSAVEKKALSRVPKEQRQSWYSIAFIWIGTMICIPMLMVGGLLSASMTFGNVLLACFLGFAICSVLMIMVGMQGTDLGLPSSMCGTKAFGDRGSSYLLSVSIFIGQMGWFGIQTATCATAFVTLMGYWNINFPFWLSCLIWGAVINGLQTSPLAMSDNKGNRVSIELENARDAVMGETIGRNLCVAFSQMGGLSGWMVRKNDIVNNLPVNSVTKCCRVGEVLRSATSSVGIFDKLAAAGLECKEIGRGVVTNVHNEQASGFDKGFVEITGADGTKWTPHFLNENLILEETSPDGVTKTRMTAPDITCYINTDTCAPLSNADIVGKNGEILVKNVAVGVMKVDEKWWRSDLAYLQKIWTRYFKILGKPDQQIVKYE